MRRKKLDLSKIPTEDLEKRIQHLEQKCKSNDDIGSYLKRTSIGPIVAAVGIATVHLIPGLIVGGIFLSMFVVGCGFTYASCKNEKLIEQMCNELSKRPKQLAMDEILQETYKPQLINKSTELSKRELLEEEKFHNTL